MMSRGSAATRNTEEQGGIRRQRGLCKGKRKKRVRKEGWRVVGMKKMRARINKKIVCDGYIRIRKL